MHTFLVTLKRDQLYFTLLGKEMSAFCRKNNSLTNRLDDALYHLLRLSDSTATSSSQSSPLTSNSSEVFSHVIDDTDQTMTETLGFKREHLSAQERMHLHGDRGVNGMSSNLTSPTSCDYSSAERRYASRSSSADSRLSCTCCPYGQHIQSVRISRDSRQ
ncbi:hypothetical protein EB796_019501 [Bugula neritina]|uniref:Uncharacterized protein n=1 Tax=Bugula neritina TaxID=10212 RepID=A0A7J7J8B6_BUGNE|nr:hypothetical protein EB796_019501 [Bugula neritina]